MTRSQSPNWCSSVDGALLLKYFLLNFLKKRLVGSPSLDRFISNCSHRVKLWVLGPFSSLSLKFTLKNQANKTVEILIASLLLFIAEKPKNYWQSVSILDCLPLLWTVKVKVCVVPWFHKCISTASWQQIHIQRPIPFDTHQHSHRKYYAYLQCSQFFWVEPSRTVI